VTNQYLPIISAGNRRDMLRKSSSELLVRVSPLCRSSAGSPAALFPVLPASSNDANETNLVLAPPAGDANRVMSNYDRHRKKPSTARRMPKHGKRKRRNPTKTRRMQPDIPFPRSDLGFRLHIHSARANSA